MKRSEIREASPGFRRCAAASGLRHCIQATLPAQPGHRRFRTVSRRGGCQCGTPCQTARPPLDVGL